MTNHQKAFKTASQFCIRGTQVTSTWILVFYFQPAVLTYAEVGCRFEFVSTVTLSGGKEKKDPTDYSDL